MVRQRLIAVGSFGVVRISGRRAPVLPPDRPEPWAAQVAQGRLRAVEFRW